MEREIVWNKRPLQNLAKELRKIKRDSYQGAESVERAILSSLEALKSNPEKYPPDKFKRNNAGNYRAFETHIPGGLPVHHKASQGATHPSRETRATRILR